MVKSNVFAACFGAMLLSDSAADFGILPDDFYTDLDGTALSAGFHHTCALEMRSDIEFGGALRCWGFDDHGQATPPQGHFIQVTSGHMFSCGIKVDETVECWGHMGSPEPGLFLQISAGEFHACGITKDSQCRCWGGHVISAITPPSGSYVQVSAGKDFSCGLRPNGRAVCWGDGRRGNTLPPEVQFKQLSASSYNYYACGLTLQGAIRCWGEKNKSGYTDDKTGPYTQVSTGNKVTCGIRASDGHIECWGVGRHIEHTEHLEHEWEQMSSGFQHLCGINAYSEVECWGPKFDGNAHAVGVPDGFVVA